MDGRACLLRTICEVGRLPDGARGAVWRDHETSYSGETPGPISSATDTENERCAQLQSDIEITVSFAMRECILGIVSRAAFLPT